MANENPHIMGCYLIIHYIQQIARVLFSPNRLQEKRSGHVGSNQVTAIPRSPNLLALLSSSKPLKKKAINMLLGGRGEHEKYSPAKLT